MEKDNSASPSMDENKVNSSKFNDSNTHENDRDELEGLKELVHGCAHKLKNATINIQNFLPLLKKKIETKGDQESDMYFRFISDSAQEIMEAIAAVEQNSLIRGIPATEEIVNLESLVPKIITRVINEGGKKVLIEKTDVFPMVKSSEDEMARLFRELVDNALKFNTSEEPVIILSCEEQHSLYTFSIEDNGIGIPEKDIEYVFHPFVKLQASKSFPGIGLGLNNCRLILAKRNGKIWIDKSSPNGTLIKFTIPK